MKSRVAAKRRWFTRRNQFRISWRSRWSQLERSLADAMLSSCPAQALAQAVEREVKSTLQRIMYENVVRPWVVELFHGLPGAAQPVGLFGNPQSTTRSHPQKAQK